MSIYNRVAELVEEKKQSLSDKELFSGKEYARFIDKKGRNIITGTFNNLRREGFPVGNHEENEVLRTVRFELIYNDSDDAPTAFCASNGVNRGDYILINSGNKFLIGSLPTREEKHWAIMGFLYHEIGHLLFTDFPTSKAWSNQMKNAIWFPSNPKRLNATVSGINLDQKLKQDEEFRDIIIMLANNIRNSVEDGYIEREIRSMMPGAGKTALATINAHMFEQQDSLAVAINKEDSSEFSALLSQLLRYAKCGELNLGDYNGPLIDDIYEMMDIVDMYGYERNPTIRIQATNELLCVLFPYLEKEIEKQEKKNSNNDSEKNSSESENGSESPVDGKQATNSTRNQSGNQGKTSKKTADSIKKEINKVSQNNGVTDSNENAQTASVVSKASGENAKQKRTSGKSNSNSHQKGAGAVGGGEKEEKDACTREMENIINQIAKSNAMSQAEKERTNAMNEEANEDYSDLGVKIYSKIQIFRDCNIPTSYIQEYDRNMTVLGPISKDLQRGIKRILKDRREGGVRKNLYFGRKLEVSSIIHDDWKYFSKRKLPTESPKLGVGLLIDESGSTSGNLINSARATAMIIEDFCRNLKIDHIINGYTTGNGFNETKIVSYSELNEIDNSNRYRICGMRSQGGTPTMTALAYMVKKMQKIDADIRLLIVISDGCSGDNENNGILHIIKNARKINTTVIAAGIGSDRSRVEEEFGEDNFVDISNIEKMPELLIGIIKKNLKL